MTYKYGIDANVLPSLAQTPVVTGSCLVYIGAAYSSDAEYGGAIRCESYKEYLNIFHGGEEPEGALSLDVAAKVAFNYVGIDHAFFVNCNGGEANTESGITVSTAINNALERIVLETSERPNIICIPTATRAEQSSAWVAALATACAGKIAGRYYGYGVVGIPYAAGQVSSGDPVPAQITKDTQSGYICSCWGDVDLGGGLVAPLETVVAALYARRDAVNTDGVPYRSIGNLQVEFAKGYKAGAQSLRMREFVATQLAAKGIITLVNRGGGQIYTWGDHTSAFSDGGTFDELYRFDSSIRVFIHILNRFIDKWRGIIDAPMTLSQRNDVLNEEQNYLNYLKAIGALIGQPRCEFRAEDNGPDNVSQGYFTFLNISTTCIPVKHLQLNVIWTADGLASYTE